MKAPVYVKIDKYKEVQHLISHVKTKVEEAKNVINKLNEVRTHEENEIHLWQQRLTDIEEKIASIQTSMEK